MQKDAELRVRLTVEELLCLYSRLDSYGDRIGEVANFDELIIPIA